MGLDVASGSFEVECYTADFLITIDGALERGTKSGRINTGPLTTLSLVLVALENFPYAIMWSFPIAYLSRKER